MEKTCNKSKFRDKNTVSTKINSLIKNGQWNRKDKSARSYYCDSCGAWHMSSMKYFDPNVKAVNVDVTFKDRWSTLFKN